MRILARSLLIASFISTVIGFKTNRTSCFHYVSCLEASEANLKQCAGGTAISLTLEAKDVNIRDLVKYRALEFVGCQDRLLKEIVDFEALQILVNEDARECFEKLPESSKRVEQFTDSCDYVQPGGRNSSKGDALQCLIEFKQDREYCESLLECCPDHTRCGERMNAVSLSYQNARVKAEQIVYSMISCIVVNDPRFLREGARLQSLRDPYRNSGVPFLRPDAYTEARIVRRLALTSTATLSQRRERFLKKYSQIRQIVAQNLFGKQQNSIKLNQPVEDLVTETSSKIDAESTVNISTTVPPETITTPEEDATTQKVIEAIESMGNSATSEEKEVSKEKSEINVNTIRNLIRSASDKDLSEYVSLISEGKFSELFELAEKKKVTLATQNDEKLSAKMSKLKDLINEALSEKEKSSEVEKPIEKEDKVEKPELVAMEDKDGPALITISDLEQKKTAKLAHTIVSRNVAEAEIINGAQSDEKKTVEPEKKKTVEPEKKKTVESEKKKTVEPEVKKTVEPEEKKTVEPEGKKTVEPEVKKTVEPEKKKIVEPEGKKTVEPEVKKTVEPEGKKTVEPEKKEKEIVELKKKEPELKKTEDTKVITDEKKQIKLPMKIEKLEKKVDPKLDNQKLKNVLNDKERALLVESEIKSSAAHTKQNLESLKSEETTVVVDDLPALEKEESSEKKDEVSTTTLEPTTTSAVVEETETEKAESKAELLSNSDDILIATKPETTVKGEIEGSGEGAEAVTATTAEPLSTTLVALPESAKPSDVVIENVKRIRPRTEQTHCQQYASCWQTVLDYEQQCDRKYSTDVLSHGIDDSEILNILHNSSISHHEIVLKACLRPLDRSVHSTLKQLLVIQRGVRKACLELGRNKIAVTDAEEALCNIGVPTTASIDEFFSSEHVRTQSNYLTCRAKLEPIREACSIVRNCCASVDTCDNYISSSPVKKLETEAIRRLVKKQNDCETKMLQTLTYIHEQLASPSRRRRFYYH